MISDMKTEEGDGLEQLKRVKQLLGMPEEDTNKDDLLLFLIEKAEDMVKNYCRIREIPEELKNIIASMAQELYRIERPGEEEAMGAVKTFSQGDMSVSFESSSSGEYPSATLLRSYGGLTFLRNYTAQLDAFRKAGW